MSDAIYADEALQAGIKAAIEHADDPTDLLNQIGAALVRSTKDRIIEGVSPDGTPFAARSQVTLDHYAKLGASHISTLRKSGDMGADIFHSYDQEQTEIGSNAMQAAMMQFGGTRASFPNLWGDIPARPYLGISSEDETNINDIVEEWLEGLVDEAV